MFFKEAVQAAAAESPEHSQKHAEGHLKIVEDCPIAPRPYQRQRAFSLEQRAKRSARVAKLDHNMTLTGLTLEYSTDQEETRHNPPDITPHVKTEHSYK